MIVYKVDEENRTVTAEFATNRDTADFWYYAISNKILKSCNNMELLLTYEVGQAVEKAIKELQGNFTATVKCQEGDEFDAEYGKELAKHRLMRKWNRTERKAIREVLDLINDTHDSLMKEARRVIFSTSRIHCMIEARRLIEH